MKVTLLPARLRLADELLENPDLPKAEIHAVAARLGECADALNIFKEILNLQAISLIL